MLHAPVGVRPNDFQSVSENLKSGSVAVTDIVIDFVKLKSVTAIQSLVMKKDFWNYEVRIGNP